MSGPGGAARIHALNVAEKPSVAKAVAEILSRGGRLQSRPGRSPYNRIFEFDYTVRQQPLHMLFTSVTGHLMELDFDDRFRRWTSCDPADLFHAPVRKLVPSDKSDLRRTLEEEARRCRWLVLWLDCDREGENIAFEVLQVCSAANPRLDVWRARFSALVDREIHHSAQNLARPNRFFSDAVDARQEIDLRIGASFTRFQTMLLADAFVLRDTNPNPNPNSHVVLSYGPCQFPTLGFIVERHWEIESHEPEQFWSIECSHVSDAGAARFAWARGHLFDHASAVLLYELCLGDPTATVAAVNHREKLKHPPHPLSTVELQKRASRYFRLGSEQTMKIAEELYQAGFISYPRTETDSFSAGTDLAAIVREQAVHPSWGAYAERLLDPGTQLWRNPSNGGHDDKAHPPIHPARYSSGEANWTADHARVYELVVRHFLACVSQPAVGAETTVEIDIAGESFAASGRTIIARNYLDVYRFESWGGSIIPTYEVGQKFMPTSLTLDAGVTRPPPPLSESDLLSCMDKAGIGTDATMHDHIKKLLDRGYATKDANTRFSPTNLGEALVMGYDGMGYELWKPYLRSMMECDMKAVSLGEKTKDEVLETCLQQMKACFLDARRNQSKLMEAMAIFFESTNRGGGDTGTLPQTVRPCNECQQSNMVLKRRPDGNFMVGCSQYPMCRNVVWLPGAISEAVVSSHVCDECNPGPVFKIQFKFRRLEIPPNYDVDHLGCIGGCDVILRELKEICGTGSRNIPASTGQPGPPSSNSRRSSQTQAACANCGQIGHSSHSCPHMSNSRTAHPPRTSNSQNGASSLPCDSCGRACPQKTANTAKNRGRKFYSCNIQECNFFVWADDSDSGVVQTRSTAQSNSRSSSSVSGSRGRGRGRARSRGSATDGTFVTATGEPVSGRCFTCGDSSHFANNCPHRRV